MKHDLLNLKAKLRHHRKRYQMGSYDCEVVCGVILTGVILCLIWS